MRDYRVADLFALRVTGAPMDMMEELGSPSVVALTRLALPAEDELAAAGTALLAALDDRAVRKEAPRNVAHKIGVRTMLTETGGELWRGLVARWNTALTALASAEQRVDEEAERELLRAHVALERSAARYLPRYLSFAGTAARRFFVDRLLASAEPGAPTSPLVSRRKQTVRDNTLVHYLQRVFYEERHHERVWADRLGEGRSHDVGSAHSHPAGDCATPRVPRAMGRGSARRGNHAR